MELERFSEFAAELLRLKVELVVTTNTRAAEAAAKLTSTVPIVVIGSGDLVGTGLAATLARPGRNVTGLTALSPELSAKRLQLLVEIVPNLRRVAVLWNPDGPAPRRAFIETQSASRFLALEITSLEVRTSDDIDRAFATLPKTRPQAMLVIVDPLTSNNAAKIVKLAAASQIPAAYPYKYFAVAGGLIAYGPDYDAMERRAAYYVDRILKGSRAAELPIEQPAKFELVVNAKTARDLGVSVPMSILSRADRVIE
jgi:putative ABC transport system substrate-binding protein